MHLEAKAISSNFIKIKIMKTFFSCLLLLTSFTFSAQKQDPVTWKATYKSISQTEGEIIVSAVLQNGWHTYSQRPTDAGPISTIITFSPTNTFELLGKAEEINVNEEYDKAFEAKVYMFDDKSEFRQKIKLKSKSGFPISFKVEFICCSETTCLPPKIVDLTVNVQ